METIFPFGLPTATAFYLTLFVLTLVVHVLFMNYVLAGTAWLAGAMLKGWRPPAKSENDDAHPAATAETILVDWIPAMLSGAITAGVAPLLFLQILYQREFYTANLLLFNRWMSILPVLIIGFYSLYVLRSQWLVRRGWVVRMLVGLAPFLCVAFVAYSWTENHLLSVTSPDTWRDFYVRGRQVYFEPQILPRLALWGLGAIPTMCLWLGWQMRYRMVHRLGVDEDSLRRLPTLAIFGVLASIVIGAVYGFSDSTLIPRLWSPMGRVYLVLATIGVLLQLFGWYRLRIFALQHKHFDGRLLGICSLGLAATLLGMSVCREVVRIISLGETRLVELIPQHAEAMRVEGFGIFLLFAVINLALIAWCFRLVKRGFVR